MRCWFTLCCSSSTPWSSRRKLDEAFRDISGCYRCYVVAWLHIILHVYRWWLSFSNPLLLVVSGSRSCTWFNMAMFLGTNRRSERGTRTVWAFGPEPNIAQQKSHEVFIEEAIQQHTVFLVKLNSQHEDDWNELVFVKWLWFVYDHFCGPDLWSYVEFRGSRKVWGFGCLTRRKKNFSASQKWDQVECRF